jgi:hypothetical protein
MFYRPTLERLETRDTLSGLYDAAVFPPVTYSAAEVAEVSTTRLFIMSGQSNMVRTNPENTFRPALEAAYPGDEIIIVKYASNGQPIRRWLADWEPPLGITYNRRVPLGDLYVNMMNAVNRAIVGKTLGSVTFLWMQGESDALQRLSATYQRNLARLVNHIRTDLDRPDMTVVIGQLSDYTNGRNTYWRQLREAQEAYVQNDPLSALVKTEDFNGRWNGIHYTLPGYQEFGRRLASAAIGLIVVEE